MSDLIKQWSEVVRAASAARRPLCLRGGGTKDFYGRAPSGEVFDTRAWSGIVNYEPTELVVTVRCGTPVASLHKVLAEHNQWLAFEPPCFGEAATVGGMVASGLSGPRRMAVGSLRDFVLGMKVMDGQGEVLSFGGEVMKNVAGYDASRLITGSLGTLGLILEVSLKVLPRPTKEATLRILCDQSAALARMNEWAAEPLPISATAWHAGQLHVRLSGARAAVDAAIAHLGGEQLADTEAVAFWASLREQSHAFFTEQDTPLWRFALPTTTPPLNLNGAQLVEWGGGQRWLRSKAKPAELRAVAAALGGHATLFRGGDRTGEVFQPPTAPLMDIHRHLKAGFDPAGIFNPGRFYEGI